MATTTVDGISETKCEVKLADLRHVAKNKVFSGFKNPEDDDISIIQYRNSLSAIIGENPTFSLLVSTELPLFFEICAYLPQDEELAITSNLLPSSNKSLYPQILISKTRLIRNASTGAIQRIEWQKFRTPPDMPMPASGAPYRDNVLYCSQGTMSRGTGGLYYFPKGKRPVPVVTNYFGRDFNSVHSVAVSPNDGALWFTDPCNGADRNFRNKPELPCQVYRYSPETGDLRVVADGLGRPHGIALSPDEKTVYVTDSDAWRPGLDEEYRSENAATTYAFDVVERSGGVFLVNKRVFSYALSGVPTGIACDPLGNVYIGGTDGVEIFSAGGGVLGVIEVPGAVSSLAFGKGGELFLCSEKRLWRVKLGGLESLVAANSSMSIEDV
ncbi:smp-30/gluconolaconase/lre-like region-containing protein [Cercophora newfieldiana]|uniref:Smp-30/gluconolaconase/lre-like region-containing protein n=1 Tax=Cercophora newfieldiana TaxID=92897 RepID=A0AA40CKF8_9PEZI|nr:smp-30/gluconolaconase/lre-like region-containing protein [Cercophora newfieldiana]